MQQSPSWEANRFSASQEIPRILWNPKIHYRIHKCPPPVPIRRQLDPVHTPTFHFLNIHLNIILPFTPGFPKWSFPIRFPQQQPVYAPPLIHTRYMPRPSRSSSHRQQGTKIVICNLSALQNWSGAGLRTKKRNLLNTANTKIPASDAILNQHKHWVRNNHYAGKTD